MRIAVFSSRKFERPYLDRANAGEGGGHVLVHLDVQLTGATASLAAGCAGVAIFTGDEASAKVLEALWAGGTRVLLLRSAGFNHVDLEAADRLGMAVLRVPAYSPWSVGEYAVGLMLTLNRKLHRAYNRVREQNFSIEGLMGFDMHAKTVGVVGTGNIGSVVCRILKGFGCTVIASDPVRNPACAAMGVEYVELNAIYERSDIITLHCPLTPGTRHMVDAGALERMKRGAMLINTSRGAVIDTRALIAALKRGKLGGVGLDVYEEEGDLFFKDLSNQVIQDDVFARLQTFPNVFITSHQGFFTHEAVTGISETTIRNAGDFERGRVNEANRVGTGHVRAG